MKTHASGIIPAAEQPAGDSLSSAWNRVVGRRSFLHGIGLAGAAAVPTGQLLAAPKQDQKLSKGDADLLRFAAAIETIEADLWQQYNELGGAVDKNDSPNPGNAAY